MAWCLDQAATMNFVVAAQVKGTLDPGALKSALRSLAQIHPFLTACIEQRADGPWVVSREHLVPALRVIPRGDEQHWLAEMEQELNTPFAWTEGPILRVTVLHSLAVSDVLLTFYHPVSDGFSGIYILRDLLMLAGALQSGAEAPLTTAFPPRPPIEELLPAETRGFTGLRKTVGLVVRQMWNLKVGRPQKLAGKPAPRCSRSARVLHHALSASLVDALTERCREENTTVHGALCAALLKAIAGQMTATGRLTLNCMSVVDLRKSLSPKLGDEIGMLASAATTGHRLMPAPDFWDLAREVRAGVSRSLAAGEPLVAMALPGKMIPKQASVEEVADSTVKLYSAATLVTNVGRLDLPRTYGPLRLTTCHFAVSLKSLSGNEFNLAASSFAGEMYLNFIYTSPNLSDAVAEEIAGETLRMLQAQVTPAGTAMRASAGAV